MVWKSCLLGLALSATAFGVSAQSRPERVMISEPVQGFAYYNRPGADLDEHNAEFRDCFVATNIDPSGGRSNLLGQGVGERLASHLIWGGVIQAIGASAVENCMIARGWRVFQLPEAEGRTVSRLSNPDFTARFAPMVGAATPPGVLARAWDNQTARPARYHTPSRPRAQSRDQLSARSFRLSGLEVQLRTADEAAGPTFSGVPGVPLDRIAAPGAGKAIVVLGGVGNRGVYFSRTAGTGGEIAFGLNANRRGLWHAFEVPAGRYRITRTSWIIHCMGAPAFDIAPGEVVYAGRFDLEGEAMGPALNPDEVPGQLGAGLRERLRPARYENGSTVPCPYGMGIYPLEIPGAPFEPGYRWGSLASQGASTAPAAAAP